VSLYLLSNPFTQPLKQLLIWLNDWASQLPLPTWFSSYAVAILIVAVLVKLLTQPLISRQQSSMRKMQELQPQMSELQKKYKDDREKLSQAQMALYKEAGVNPFGGCLPLLVQMVVLFGLWRAIYQLAQPTPTGQPGPMYGEQFFWVPNLAACEPSPFCGKETALLPLAIPILVIVMTISQILYQRVMTPPSKSGDSQQQAMNSMMKFMPIMFAYIFLKLPSGVVLYYTAFNVVGLIQQSISNRLSEKKASAALLSAPVDYATAPVEVAETADSGKEQASDDGSTGKRRGRRRKGR
jgi:YidC/Oxa1 family membrane protein insertase